MFGGLTIAILVGRAIALVIGFTLHEYAHAWTAYRLGDSTPLFNRRLTLDPRAHLEPLGIVLALIVGFGWAKPVAYNPSAFYPNEKRGTMIVAMAGPIANLLIAIVFGLILRGWLGLVDSPTGVMRFLLEVMITIVLFNVVLMVFNLIPLFPLDGWKVMLGLVPDETSSQLRTREQEAMFILILILMIGALNPIFNILGFIFDPIIDIFFSIVVGI